ncbi:HCP-like protein [Backusella circina FSU 941]|nr:HCP-like protein [Backusella circina FSU 941]
MFTIFKKQEENISDSELFAQIDDDDIYIAPGYIRKAKAGAAEAIYEIGEAYYARGSDEDFQKAMVWYHKSATKGYPAAINDIGYIYMEGLGVDIDYKLAMEYFLKASEHKLSMAFYNIGYMYHYGLGVSVDFIDAEKWLRQASHQGNTLANNLLGAMYRNGNGVPVDYKLAMVYYKKGKDAGHIESTYQIGYMYEKGLGVSVDKQTALSYYTLIAEKSHDGAQSGVQRLNDEGYFLTDKVVYEISSSETGWQEKGRKRSERRKQLQKFLEEDEEEIQDIVRRVLLLEHEKREMAKKLENEATKTKKLTEKVVKLEDAVSKLGTMLNEMKIDDASTVNIIKEKSSSDVVVEENSDEDSDFLDVKKN